MSLVRYEPFALFDRLQREVNARGLWDQFFGDADQEAENPLSRWRPAVDIKEEDQRYVIYADLPGVDARDIEVTMEGGVLTLKGERNYGSEDEKQGYRRVERSQGVFLRRFSLPDTADVDKIEAQGKDGVLKIVIPKQEKLQPRRITVNG